MEKKQIIELIDRMIDSYEMDLKDEELMSTKCTFELIAKTHIITLNYIKGVLK